MNTGPGGCSKRASRARSSTPSLYFALSDRATHRAAFIGQANIAKRFLANGFLSGQTMIQMVKRIRIEEGGIEYEPPTSRSFRAAASARVIRLE